MKEIKILLLFLFLNSTLIGQNFKWAVGEGSSAFDRGRAVTTDNIGNVYITGVFTDTADFDPSTSVYNLIPSGALGGHEIFVQKLDSSGNFVWAKKFGGVGSEWVNDIEVDNFGNIFVTGNFVNTADFDPGFGTFNLTSYGGEDAFLLRLNTLGNLVWAKQFGGPSTDIGVSIDLDPPNYIYLIGDYRFTADFDPNLGTYNLTSKDSSNDVYICKLNYSSALVWAKGLEGNNNDNATGIEYVGGEVYVSGYFRDTIDLDPSAGISQFISKGQTDGFLLKLNSSGNFLWANQIGGTSLDAFNDVSVDGFGNPYICGYFSNTVDFDPGAGAYNLTASFFDIFVAKFDISGSFQWAKSFGGLDWDASYSCITNFLGETFVTGFFTNDADFDPGIGVNTIYSVGDEDVFVLKLDASGNVNWVTSFGGIYDDMGFGIAIDQNNNVITTGKFRETVDFNNGFGTYNQTANGSWEDIFIHKMGSQYVSVNEFEDEDKGLTIYPNPSSNQINIIFDNVLPNHVLKMYSSDGKLILSQPVMQSRTVLDVSKFDTGVYYLISMTYEKIMREKIIVQK